MFSLTSSFETARASKLKMNGLPNRQCRWTVSRIALELGFPIRQGNACTSKNSRRRDKAFFHIREDVVRTPSSRWSPRLSSGANYRIPSPSVRHLRRQIVGAGCGSVPGSTRRNNLENNTFPRERESFSTEKMNIVPFLSWEDVQWIVFHLEKSEVSFVYCLVENNPWESWGIPSENNTNSFSQMPEERIPIIFAQKPCRLNPFYPSNFHD